MLSYATEIVASAEAKESVGISFIKWTYLMFALNYVTGE